MMVQRHEPRIYVDNFILTDNLNWILLHTHCFWFLPIQSLPGWYKLYLRSLPSGKIFLQQPRGAYGIPIRRHMSDDDLHSHKYTTINSNIKIRNTKQIQMLKTQVNYRHSGG